ncbi:hypothetical protein EVAR_54183_1 [Eumeta japonica]|uniref:Uncharacterized protein n=1 Tax=Eumeta variegata TaxID=151549 RepID=A0A4C1ZBD3_EUMVA|nr:hypothetical protein EVAR_54183_1 [Eumeta japonica]
MLDIGSGLNQKIILECPSSEETTVLYKTSDLYFINIRVCMRTGVESDGIAASRHDSAMQFAVEHSRDVPRRGVKAHPERRMKNDGKKKGAPAFDRFHKVVFWARNFSGEPRDRWLKQSNFQQRMKTYWRNTTTSTSSSRKDVCALWPIEKRNVISSEADAPLHLNNPLKYEMLSQPDLLQIDAGLYTLLALSIRVQNKFKASIGSLNST